MFLPPAFALQFKTFGADRNVGWILAVNTRMDTDIFVFIRAFEADKKGFILQRMFFGDRVPGEHMLYEVGRLHIAYDIIPAWTF